MDNNAVLTLVSTDVILTQGHAVSVQGTGQLIGEEATIAADGVQASGQSLLTGIESGSLTVEANVQWGCMSTRNAQHLNIVGDLTVQPGCQIDITGGGVQGTVLAMTGAEFTSSSTLDLLVLDKGEPVENALISIEGSVAMTDVNGQLSTQTVAQRVTDTGETWEASNSHPPTQQLLHSVTWDTNRRSLTPSWPPPCPLETFLDGLCRTAMEPIHTGQFTRSAGFIHHDGSRWSFTPNIRRGDHHRERCV